MQEGGYRSQLAAMRGQVEALENDLRAVEDEAARGRILVLEQARHAPAGVLVVVAELVAVPFKKRTLDDDDIEKLALRADQLAKAIQLCREQRDTFREQYVALTKHRLAQPLEKARELAPQSPPALDPDRWRRWKAKRPK